MTGHYSAAKIGPQWPPRDDPRITRIITALQRGLPDDAAQALRLIGIGLSTIVIGDDETVCRVPLNHEAAAAQERLRHLLPLLAPYLPVAIPAPLQQIPACAGLPFGALVMRTLPGVRLTGSCTSTTVARTLADSLLTLHALPTTIAPATLLPHHDCDAADRAIRDAALPTFQAAVPGDMRAAAEWWNAWFADAAQRKFRPVIVHGDFWHENILVDATRDRVTGILDWESCGIGGPAMDLAPLWHANPVLFAEVLTRYANRTGDAAQTLRRRARWQFGRREWAGLAWAIRLHDTAELPDAIAKVRVVVADAGDG